MNSSAFNARKPASMATIADKIDTGPSDNFDGQRLVGMTFNMPQNWHARFKIAAAKEGISMRSLLEKCFAEYEAKP